MSDSPTGTDRAPDRYVAQGRETIDRQRDLAHDRARILIEEMAAVGRLEDIADDLFAFLCDAQAMRYRDRMGRKGDPSEDGAKARFYEAMSIHVGGDGPDPRHQRPGFVSYVRP